MKPHIMQRLVDPEGKGTYRVIISTPLPESSVAGYLTELAARVEPKGVKVGSYPHWERSRNTVTLVGKYVFWCSLFYTESLCSATLCFTRRFYFRLTCDANISTGTKPFWKALYKK